MLIKRITRLLISRLAQKTQLGFTKDVKTLLTKYGASKLSDVAPEHYEALMRDAEELGNE